MGILEKTTDCDQYVTCWEEGKYTQKCIDPVQTHCNSIKADMDAISQCIQEWEKPPSQNRFAKWFRQLGGLVHDNALRPFKKWKTPNCSQFASMTIEDRANEAKSYVQQLQERLRRCKKAKTNFV